MPRLCLALLLLCVIGPVWALQGAPSTVMNYACP